MSAVVYQGKDTIMRMKTRLFTVLILAGCFTASAQPQQPDGQPPFQSSVHVNAGQALLRSTVDPITGQPMSVGENLKRFDLTFPGGTPGEFIKAINEQAAMKVNVIIPPEYAKEQLPPLEVYDVKLPQLFEAGIVASTRSTNLVSVTHYNSDGRPLYETFEITKGFKTTDAPPTDNSIWSFFVQRPPNPSTNSPKQPVEVRIYQMSGLLNSYSIEDITTAIKTTWEMLDSGTKPEMKFHAETKLLIAKGTAEQLLMVGEVVSQLSQLSHSTDSNEQYRRRIPASTVTVPPSQSR